MRIGFLDSGIGGLTLDKVAGRLEKLSGDRQIIVITHWPQIAAVAGRPKVDAAVADAALNRLEVDQIGLDAMDRRYLRCIAENYGGGPVGVETLAAALSESRDTLEEVVEPYLLQQGLIQRTPRGRMLSASGFKHIGLNPPRDLLVQLDLLASLPEGEAE